MEMHQFTNTTPHVHLEDGMEKGRPVLLLRCTTHELDQIFHFSYSKHQQSSKFNWGRKTVLKGKYFPKIPAFLMANLEAE
jgi:hypothetical protein